MIIDVMELKRNIGTYFSSNSLSISEAVIPLVPLRKSLPLNIKRYFLLSRNTKIDICLNPNILY